tara:strand:+ start:86 stop:505 length:420 start_codon:yes stop_codon:yes gene_type:complete
MSFEERLWRKAEREADEAVEKKLREAKVREEQLHRDADIHVDPVDGGAGAGGTAGLVLALQPREAAIAALVLPPPPPPRRLAERSESRTYFLFFWKLSHFPFYPFVTRHSFFFEMSSTGCYSLEGAFSSCLLFVFSLKS